MTTDLHLTLKLGEAVFRLIQDDPDTTVTVEDRAIVLAQNGVEVYIDIDPDLADDYRQSFSELSA